MLSVLTLFGKSERTSVLLGPDKIFQICGLTTRVSKVEQKLFNVVVKNAF